jgi:hypothetical protein
MLVKAIASNAIDTIPVAITTAKYAGWKSFTTLRMMATHCFMNASSRMAVPLQARYRLPRPNAESAPQAGACMNCNMRIQFLCSFSRSA